MRKSLLWICMVTLLCISCESKKVIPENDQNVGTSTNIEGDSTLYGLACDGCNDSVLVFLPGKGGDPIIYDILNASKRNRVIGHPKVGDWVAVLLNANDTTVADMVIDLDQLKGTWVEQVFPTVRERITPTALDEETKKEQDSLLQEMMKPIEMGFAIKSHYAAQTIGRRRQSIKDDDSPVVYPQMKNYTKWHVFNGYLILTSQSRPINDSLKGDVVNDTAQFIFMTHDSLKLKFKDCVKGFYRKN